MKTGNQLEILINEHEIITTHIHQQIAANDKLASLSFTFISAGFLLAYKEGLDMILQLLTIIFGGLIIYALYHYTITFSNVGYLKRIEEEINLISMRNILVRTKIWDQTIVNNYSLRVIYGIIGFIYSVMIYLSLLSSSKGNGLPFLNVWGLALLHVFLIISIIVSFRLIFDVYNKSYKIADNGFSNDSKEGIDRVNRQSDREEHEAAG